VTLVKATAESIVFLAEQAEKDAWCDLLTLYPLQTSVIQPEEQSNAVDQQLLEESLSSQRQSNARELALLKKAGGGFVMEGNQQKLSLTPAQVETLLQILNDLRVGSWQALGCPDQMTRNHIKPSEASFRQVWIMELAGHFQMALLEACAAVE
jgi:hypothetical protein